MIRTATFALMLAFFRNDMGFGGNNGMTDFKDILGFNVNASGTRIALFVALVMTLCAIALAQSTQPAAPSTQLASAGDLLDQMLKPSGAGARPIRRPASRLASGRACGQSAANGAGSVSSGRDDRHRGPRRRTARARCRDRCRRRRGCGPPSAAGSARGERALALGPTRTTTGTMNRG